MHGSSWSHSRRSLAQRLTAARRHTDELLALIRPEALYARAVAERHRFIFYLGHLEAFDWNLFRSHVDVDPGAPAVPSELDQLFAFGIDPDLARCEELPRDKATDWPAVATVLDYRESRRQLVDQHLGALPEQLLHVAIEHRYMHAETLCYLMHWLPLSAKRPPCLPQPDARPVPAAAVVTVPGGQATLGRSEGFGWDNEFPEHRVAVPEFVIDKYKVTNAQYLRFVQKGGPLPHFWRQQADGTVLLRCMFGEIPLPMSWPVYVTHEQASAYAAFVGGMLPSEPQFHRAAYGTADAGERAQPWADSAELGLPLHERGNFDFQRWDPVAVDAHAGGESAFGVAQLVGNGWEWTRTPFAPFDGFAPFPFYPGYSADFFDGRHFVLKGGSARTAASLLRRSFRNWFRAGYRYVYASFRCVDR